MKLWSRILSGSLSMALILFVAPTRVHAFNRVLGDASAVVAAGKSHVILSTSHAVFGWGTNASGELGLGTTASPKATPTFTPAIGSGIVAAGSSFSLAINGGKLYGWGKNDNGQTGTGASTTSVTSATQVGTSTAWRQAAAGSTHGLAITSGGKLFGWGQNSDGEIGLGNTTTPVKTPTVISSASRWISAAGGNQFTLAIKTNGSLWSWGHNASGQLGNGNTTAQHSPVAVTSTVPWVAIAAGDSHALGIKADGSLWSWGANAKNQLGCNASCPASTSSPINISGGTTWVAVSAGGNDSFAIRSDGILFAWGDNGLGQLGISNSFATVKSPTAVSGSLRFQFVSAGFDFTAAVTADGTVWAWGNEASGQLGNGTATAGAKTTVPGQVPPLLVGTTVLSFVQTAKPPVFAGGQIHGAHIRSSGVLATFGYSGYGALGLGSTQSGVLNQIADQCDNTVSPANCEGPVAVTYVKVGGTYQTNTLPWNKVATGQTHTLAIRADGTLWAFGNNGSGELGNNSTTQVPVAVQITNSHGTTWNKVFAAPTQPTSFGIDSSGQLWAWGNNGVGALGVGDTSDRHTPTLVSVAGEYWVDIAPGAAHTLGLTSDGKLWSWGNNDYGELGLDSNTVLQELVPTSPTGTSTTPFIGIAVGRVVSSAIDGSGQVWGTGYNSEGELGDGTTTWRSAFGAIPAIGNVTSLCRTSSTALAMLADGTVEGWGANFFGELATGDTNTYLSPETMSWAGLGITAVACLDSGSYGMDSSTTVWGAGDNSYGSLGILLAAAGPFSFPQSGDTDTIYPFVGNVLQDGITAKASSGTAVNIVTSNALWDSGTNQATNQFVELDLPGAQAVSGISLVANDAATYPRTYNVQVSTNGTTWTTVASGTSVGQVTAAAFPVQYSRFFRLTLTGSASAHWTIAGNPEPLLY